MTGSSSVRIAFTCSSMLCSSCISKLLQLADELVSEPASQFVSLSIWFLIYFTASPELEVASRTLESGGWTSTSSIHAARISHVLKFALLLLVFSIFPLRSSIILLSLDNIEDLMLARLRQKLARASLSSSLSQFIERSQLGDFYFVPSQLSIQYLIR